jgi:hypothetical protein
MPRLCAAAFLFLLGAGMFSLAQGAATIGCYDDPNYTLCYGDIEQYVAKTVYVALWLPPEIYSIRSCKFRIDNLPLTGPEGIRTDYWTSDFAIGDPSSGISLHWGSPQVGVWVLLGEMEFFMIQETWIGEDHVMTPVGLPVAGQDFYIMFESESIEYTFNCTDPWECLCIEGYSRDGLLASETSWGSIKSLY